MTKAILCALAMLTLSQEPNPEGLLKKTLDTYSKAKSFQSQWSYRIERTGTTEKATIEIKWMPPAKLYYRVSALPPEKAGEISSIPSMLVVVDGKTATFENSTTREFYQFALPKNAKVPPLALFPMVAAASGITRDPDVDSPEGKLAVLRSKRQDGGLTRMMLSLSSNTIRRMETETPLATLLAKSVIAVESEAFDKEIPDSAFIYPKQTGFRQIAPPPGAAELFGFNPQPRKP